MAPISESRVVTGARSESGSSGVAFHPEIPICFKFQTRAKPRALTRSPQPPASRWRTNNSQPCSLAWKWARSDQRSSGSLYRLPRRQYATRVSQDARPDPRPAEAVRATEVPPEPKHIGKQKIQQHGAGPPAECAEAQASRPASSGARGRQRGPLPEKDVLCVIDSPDFLKDGTDAPEARHRGADPLACANWPQSRCTE